jgi:nucleotide-binding universal stress UspA family protein
MTAQDGNGQRRIVVGVDGSVPSKAALTWAISQAKLTGAVIEAVIAWDFPAMVGYPMLMSEIDFEHLATQIVGDAVSDVAGGDEQVKITTRVIQGNPAQVLVEESVGADLLVVGNRGHGGFVEAMLGSTGQHCVHHASCPVLVVRDAANGPQTATGRGTTGTLVP